MGEYRARVLVVDDEAAIRLTLDALLRRRGYQVAVAASGAEALAYLAEYPVDLVLLDLIMPGMPGLEVARHVRAMQPTASIMILTGSDVLAEVELGGDSYLLKTASPQDILTRLAAVLAGHSAQAQRDAQAGDAHAD